MTNSLRPSLLLRILTLALVFTLGISNVSAYELSTSIDVNNPEDLARIEEGQKLFKANCNSCHLVDRKMTGPALAGAWDRWDSQENLIAWVKNSQGFLKTGNKYANDLYKEYNQSVMTAFPQLTDAQVINIMDYVRAKDAGVFPIKVAGEESTSNDGGEAPSSGPSKTVLWLLVGFLLAMFGLLWRVSGKLDKIAKEKDGIEVPESKPLLNRLLNKRVMSTIGLLVFLLVAYNIGKGAIDLGRSQGYAPEQPIAFSHALHAGQNQIDCEYCHTGAQESKHAYMPSVTVCMNCHKYVQEGPTGDTSEINKIYEYSGWNKQKSAFTNPPKRLKWVKIHNLPDHVYFSHAQHVNAGKIECQTCHGQVQEMEVVEQFAPLSMGWCINCHRDTEIQFQDNKYYDNVYKRYHEEIKNNERSGVTVEEIGGTECQKCHY